MRSESLVAQLLAIGVFGILKIVCSFGPHRVYVRPWKIALSAPKWPRGSVRHRFDCAFISF